MDTPLEDTPIGAATDKNAEKREKAAEIVALLATDAGKRLRAQIADLKKSYQWAPENLTRYSSGAGGGAETIPFLEVDSFRVANLIGARMALDAVLDWLFEQEKIVAKAAEEAEKREKEKGAPPG